MRIKINREQPFQVLATNFSIGPSSSGYDLQISADGVNFTTLFSVGANVTRMVTGVANGSTYRLQYNTDEDVIVNWERQCNDGSGSGSGYILPIASETTLGGVKVGDGLDIDANGVLSSQGGSIDSGAVKTIVDNEIDNFSQELQDGGPIVGMSKQLYSPDGVTSEGTFNYRTTAGEESVATGDAELREVGGNMSYPEAMYNDSAALERGGEPVTGFTYDIQWGNTAGWEEYVSRSENEANQVRKMKFTRTSNSGRLYVNVYFGDSSAPSSSSFAFNFTQTTLARYDKTTAITSTHLSFDAGLVGDITYDGTDIIIEVADTYSGWGCLRDISKDSGAAGTSYNWGGINIPNDIPFGESTYAYAEATSAWTPSLPQAITNLKVDDVDYVPEDGDEITINREVYKEGTAVVPAPTKFVALGFNSFSKDGDTDISSYTEDNGVYSVAVYAVAGLSDGYVVYSQNSGITAAGIGSGSTAEADTATTTYGAAVSIVYPTVEKPYILVTTTDIEGLCIHPRWSGYRDEDYEGYSKSEVAIDFNSDCPLYAVGSVRNTWNLVNGEGTMAVTREAYTAARVEELLDAGKVIGTDFDFDANYIYVVAATASTVALSVSNYSYKDNDFSVEYFVDANGIIPVGVYAETWYMNNLVDKLRNMQGLVHLDNLNGTGKEDTIYECDDHLWTWNSNSGVCAEWNGDAPNTTERGYGLIFSHIPDGQKILDFKYNYNNELRNIVMSGDTLVLTNTGGVITTCTVGNQVNFASPSSSYKITVKYDKHYIGFYVGPWLTISNVWDGKTSGGHFEIVDHTNHPFLPGDLEGVPYWNSKGEIIGRKFGAQSKTVYANTTGYSNSAAFLVGNNASFPDRIFVPTVGGTAGQILTSGGENAAPTWATMIKAVKITSDAYEALQDKDPNTLYLIDDE